MAFYDRPYYKDDRCCGPMQRAGLWSITTWIIFINIGVFVLDALLAPELVLFTIPATAEGAERTIGMTMAPLSYWGHFSAETAIYSGQIWRFISFQFLHAGIFHILFNMLVLFFFGPMIESHLGSRRFLAFYLLCGIAGPVMYLLLWQAGVLVGIPTIPMIGASAGVFGVLIGAARIAPDTTVMLLIPPIPVKLKVLAWVVFGIALFTVVAYGQQGTHNVGGEAAHLGGAILGFILVRRANWLNFALMIPTRLRRAGAGEEADFGPWPRAAVDRTDEARKPGFFERRRAQRDEAQAAEVDRILSKVATQGLHSLTSREKRILQSETDRRRAGR